MSATLCIKGATLLDPAANTIAVGDLRITGDTISEVGASLQAAPDERVIDAAGCWLMPGFIDMHTHLRDLGQSDRETVGSGTRSAAAGGYTTVVAMANTDPPIDNALVMGRMRELVEKYACIQVLPVACVTRGMAGVELTNMCELAQMGAAAFSDDGMPITDLGVLRRALEYVELCGKFIISHPEDKALSAGGAMNEGAPAVRLGLPGIPTASESACIAREIEVVRYTGARLHFAHVSAAASVELIRNARQSGVNVSADVTPHHLSLCDEDIVEFDSAFKMNPPLRSKHDQEALVKGLLEGTIDAVATDHAPHPHTEKQKAFTDAPFGVIGLETAFSLVLTRLTGAGLKELDVVRLFTTNPARLLSLPQPTLTKGGHANLCLFDPRIEWTYEAAHGFSKSKNTPFNGRKLRGKNVLTIYQGKVVYDDAAQARGRSDKECVSV